MDASVEMKAQALEGIIGMRMHLANTQEMMNVNCGFVKTDPILVYSTEEFAEYARYFGTQVYRGDNTDAGIRLKFFHMDTELVAYASSAEMCSYFEEEEKRDADGRIVLKLKERVCCDA